jgi:hypothetical protein
MAEDEGSVVVDGVDSDESLETSEETSETKTDTSSKEGTEHVESQDKESSDSENSKSSDKEDEKNLTDKGTKLDPDPLSQANQLKANAEARARQYEAILNDPERLKVYVSELEKERGIKSESSDETIDFDKLDPTKLETVEDLQKYALGLKQATRQEISRLHKDVENMKRVSVAEGLTRNIQNQIVEVQTKYSELREYNSDNTKNPDYNEDLDRLISDTYKNLDYDPQSGSYRGRISLTDIADKIMNAKKLGEGSGSRKAKTDIIDKQGGRIAGISTTSSDLIPDDSKLEPAAAIAQRMKRAAGKR